MRKLIQTIKESLNRSWEARVDAYAAQTAFYIIMGFIPFIMLLLMLIPYTPVTEANVMELLQEIFPAAFWEFLEGIVRSIFVPNTAILSGTAIACLWACARGVMAITNGLNSIRGITETRNYFYRRARAVFYILILLLSLLLSMVLLVFGNELHTLLLDLLPGLQRISDLLIWLRTCVTLLILMLLLAAMYTWLPDVKIRFLSQLPGAAAAAVSWAVFSYFMSLYMTWTKRASIYGSLTTLVMIMLWVYVCMWLLFAGAQLNCYFFETRTAENRKKEKKDVEKRD